MYYYIIISKINCLVRKMRSRIVCFVFSHSS